MRRLYSISALVALVVAATPLATADHTSPCPEYTVIVGDGTTGVGANEDGQAVVNAAGFHVFVDEVASNGYVFSIWLYPESNGQDGGQRHDDYCTTPGTDESTRDGWYF